MNKYEKLESILNYLNPNEKSAVLCSLEGPTHRGGVVNPKYLQAVKEDFPYFSFFTDSNRFSFAGQGLKPGLSPLHFGGAFYLLDPASALVPLLLSGRHQVVLDLCAAPGGKTITYALNHPETLIVANDISLTRSHELARNIERMSLSNVIVTSIDPLKIPSCFDSFFDAVLLDAPCSGSGMFNKDEKMADDWSLDKVKHCVTLQKQLIEKAASLVVPGGQLLYSTCSYSFEEDDEIVSYALSICPNLQSKKVANTHNLYDTEYGFLTFPNLFKGEGQYMALMEKKGFGSLRKDRTIGTKGRFLPYEFNYKGKGFGTSVPVYGSLLSLPIIKPGLKLYDDRQYAKASYNHDCRTYVPLSPLALTREQADSFISGNELTVAQEKALKKEVVLTYKNLPLGYGRLQGNRVKNLLPKGLYAKNIRR